MKFTAKISLALVILVVIIISSSLYTLNYLRKTCTELENYVIAIENGVKAEDWENVLNNMNETSEKWSKAKKIWAMLIDHMEIDNIDETLVRMEEYIKAKDSSSALAEASALKLFLKHIPEKEKLSLENVL